jgi:hypothetical protein
LVYIRSGFGSYTDTAVGGFSPINTKNAYAIAPKSLSIATSHAQLIDKGLVSSLGGFFPATYSMTQNELWWMYFAEGTGTTIVQATAKMVFFEASVLYTTGTVSYKAGGYIVTFLDYVNPNINIAIGNTIGAAVDMAVTVVETVSNGTSYVDLPLDAEGNWIFPDEPIDTNFSDFDWEDCEFIGC